MDYRNSNLHSVNTPLNQAEPGAIFSSSLDSPVDSPEQLTAPDINTETNANINRGIDFRSIGDSTVRSALEPELRQATIVPETPQFEEAPKPPEGVEISSSEDSISTSTNRVPTTGQNTSQAPVTSHEINQTPTVNHDTIRITGDRLSDTSISEIEQLEERLNQTGDFANFYDAIRDAGESIRDNFGGSGNQKAGA